MLFWLFSPLLAVAHLADLAWNPYFISSGSMKPTLLVGDYLNVVQSDESFARGEVLVFRHPLNDQHYVKRLIGMPGDTIQMRNGVLYINEVSVEVEAIDPFVEVFVSQGSLGAWPRCNNGPVAYDEHCEKGQQIETLPNGTWYQTLDIGNTSMDNTLNITVPEGHFFFMGDNRDNSADSRFSQSAGGMGLVPVENVVGRAKVVLFSASGPSFLAFWTWRSDRYFVGIN
ncbi:signal peptidase I [Yoonia sp. I 8.24]|uniref:signal peptidase I n=1 Tax=Yoonia sp. I 8.24 TaxID=1537229 RepID=UPI001EDD77C4|nr:signal peptidase I [Yoonia sp. I 8.24]MCG3269264.1 signal peptidase I [Yoonia sp. I 8.24]